MASKSASRLTLLLKEQGHQQRAEVDLDLKTGSRELRYAAMLEFRVLLAFAARHHCMFSLQNR